MTTLDFRVPDHRKIMISAVLYIRNKYGNVNIDNIETEFNVRVSHEEFGITEFAFNTEQDYMLFLLKVQ